MAITDPQAISFCNNKLRPAMDCLASALATCESLVLAWNNGISALVPNTTAVLQDGASLNGIDATGGDGRRVLTGVDINNAMTRANEMLNYKNNGTLTTGTAAVGPYNTVIKPAVNNKPAF